MTIEANMTTCFWNRAAGLKEEWYAACTSVELQRDKPLPCSLYGRPLVLFRDARGTACALIDQCVHRGLPLSAGTLRQGHVTCPYHGWSYDGTGNVVHIPSIDGKLFPCTTPHHFSQRAFGTKEQDGLVWVYPGDKPEAERPPVFSLPFFTRAGWTSYYIIGTYQGELDAVAQNIMDVTHTIFVHNKWFRSEAGKQVKATVDIQTRSVSVSYDDSDNNVGMMPWLTNPHKAPQVHTDKFFAPNITLVEYHWGESSGIAFNSLISPLNEQSCRVYTCVSYKLPWPSMVARLIKPFLHAYTKIVNQQDIHILAKRRTGLENLPRMKQHSVRADMAHVAIEKILVSLQTGQAISPNLLGTKTMDFQI